MTIEHTDEGMEVKNVTNDEKIGGRTVYDYGAMVINITQHRFIIICNNLT